VVHRHNTAQRLSSRPLLVFMGDDTHLGEKLKAPAERDHVKASREIGYQPAWDDMAIRKHLAAHSISREQTIREYTARLE
jgi:hypothetical protein